MKIQFNGQNIHIPSSITLGAFLQERSIDAKSQGIAVALNDGIIQRSQWDLLTIREGDIIEVVLAVQGG